MIPLSTAMRPSSLDDFKGQKQFLYKGSLLYNSIKKGNFESAIFYGPSGTGKTTLARIIAKEMNASFVEMNATVDGIQELKQVIKEAEFRFNGIQNENTYLYVDEFHRWNKLQQDSLLKALEEGVIRFIGSTTENPYFSINNAVLSRVRALYEFHRHEPEDLIAILNAAICDESRGLGKYNLEYDEDAIHLIAELSNGDARIALDTLGFIADNIEDGHRIDAYLVGEALQTRIGFYDKREDKYDLLSALQKSIRGSDPDASIHYLARLIEGGADVQMIGRRLLVIASEDIGLAYPMAISVVTSCVQAASMVGLPEARINLAEAVLMLSSSPKSNSSIMAIDSAISDIKRRKIDEVPLHLKDSHYSGAKKRGVEGYLYPHNFGGYVEQQYLPNNLYKDGTKYYNPTENGREAAFGNFLNNLHKNDKNKK